MFNFRRIRSWLALLLLACMLVSTLMLNSCDIIDKIFGKDKKPTINPNAIVDPIDDNYRTLYQIYVRSFADSDGDGIGDIRGIIETFDYLNDGDISSGNDLGVQAIWLTPIFEGASGHKYDAIDFTRIDPSFGDEDDLAELIQLCDDRNVKLILDFALNHTSTSCQWFIESKNAHLNGDKSNQYYDYYNWNQTGGTGYVKLPKSNWYYESNFDTGGGMPELNYDNDDVKNEMLEIAKYWMNLGVDGFRFDAVKYIFFNDNSKSAEFYDWFNGELRKEFPDIYLIGECWSEDYIIKQYYSSMNCFYFPTAGSEGAIANAAKGGAISNFVDTVVYAQKNFANTNPDAMLSLFLSNHDQIRSWHYFGINNKEATVNKRKMAASLYLLAPGTPVIYYGEEIGLEGSQVNGSSGPEDANYRLPMKWGDIWTCEVPNGATYDIDVWKNTVDDQRKDENSLMMHYAKVLSVRHSYPAIARGTYNPLYAGKATFGGFFVDYGEDDMIILHNTSASETVTIDLTTLKSTNNSKILANYTTFELLECLGVSSAELNGTTLIIGPQTTVIIQ